MSIRRNTRSKPRLRVRRSSQREGETCRLHLSFQEELCRIIQHYTPIAQTLHLSNKLFNTAFIAYLMTSCSRVISGFFTITRHLPLSRELSVCFIVISLVQSYRNKLSNDFLHQLNQIKERFPFRIHLL